MSVPKVCRLCLSEDNLVSIFEDKFFNSEDIFQASGVQVQPDDGLPQKICPKCSQDLKYVLDFREKCKNTEKELIVMKEGSGSEIESCGSEDIKEPLYEVDVTNGINIKFEMSESDEDKVMSKEFNEQVACKICQRYIFKRRLKIHMVEWHAELVKSREKCELCIEYVHKEYMSKHLLSVHKDGFICIYCKENCRTREGLMKHLETCSETCRRRILYTRELIECNLCHVLMTRGQLYRHRRMEHSNLLAVYKSLPNNQKVTCDICELKFYSEQGLNTHKEKHYAEVHFEITSVDGATPIKTKRDRILRDRRRFTRPKNYSDPESAGGKVFIESLSDVEEQALAEWLMQMQDRQFILDKTSIFNSIEIMIGDPGVPQSHLISWICDFLERHPEIEVRETKKLEDVYSNCDVQVRKWFGNMKNYLMKNNLKEVMDDPSRVFSSDERLFFSVTYENKYRLVQDKSHNVLFSANAAGVLAPPMIVFAYKEVPEEVMEKIPDEWAVRRADNGIMCCNNFYEYIRDVFNPWLEEAGIRRPVVLFLNAYTSFLTFQLCNFCFQNGVELVALYPYSNEITPMELALFKPMDSLWKRAISRKDGRFPEVKNLARLLRNVVVKIPVDTIKRGFEKAGLFPMDFKNIDVPKMATVKRYDYFRNSTNHPRKFSNERQLRRETQDAAAPKVGKVCRVYLSKKQLMERKKREEGVKVEVNESESYEMSKDDSGNNDFLELRNSYKEGKDLKRKTQEKLMFESSDESE